jgi:molybdate transport system substrate-binding protein
VYATDAQIDHNVRVVDAFPDNTHAPIIYPIALTAMAKADAIKFIDYVRGSAGDTTFKKYGFVPLH